MSDLSNRELVDLSLSVISELVSRGNKLDYAVSQLEDLRQRIEELEEIRTAISEQLHGALLKTVHDPRHACPR